MSDLPRIWCSNCYELAAVIGALEAELAAYRAKEAAEDAQ